MPRLIATELKAAGPGVHSDGNGLYLQVKNGGRSWILRYRSNGRERYKGLGPFPEVSLAKARAAAVAYREKLRAGIDPIEETRQRRQEARLAAARAVTFEVSAQLLIAKKKHRWRTEKNAQQWETSLATYAYPKLGALPVQDIDTGLITQVLNPIWNTKPETASRVLQRIEAVLNWAAAHGYRTGDNPARWKGHLEHILAKPSDIKKVEHFAALPFDDMPAFFGGLGKRSDILARAIAFTILTAARTAETRFATVGEIDFKNSVWTIPEGRTKSGRAHRVPLTKEALSLVSSDGDADTLLFPGISGKKPFGHFAMRKYLKDELGQPTITVHGFRSTFRDWVGERTTIAREIAEAALSHAVGDATERAYKRGDALERRRRLMSMWAKFCTSGAEATVEKVIPIRRGA